MVIQRFPDSDAIYVRLSPKPPRRGEVSYTVEVYDDIGIDVGKNEELMGVEVINARLVFKKALRLVEVGDVRQELEAVMNGAQRDFEGAPVNPTHLSTVRPYMERTLEYLK